MAEERLVGGAALPNGAVGCRILDGVVVVVAGEERRFARTIKVGAGAGSGGRPTKLLKVAASDRGVAPSCNSPAALMWSSAKERRVECCSFWWWKRSVYPGQR